MLGVRIKYQNYSLKFLQKKVFVQIYGGGGGIKTNFYLSKMKLSKISPEIEIKFEGT